MNRQSPNSLSLKSRTNLIFGVILSLSLFLASGLITYINIRTLNRIALQIAETHEVLLSLNDILSLAIDAETGQRGYIITGDEKYLAPYSSALFRMDSRVNEVERLTRFSPDQQARIPPLRAAISAKLTELGHTIELRRANGFDAAKDVVATDRGKVAMDGVRTQLQDMYTSERTRRKEHIAAMDVAYNIAIVSGLLTCLVGLILSCVVAMLMRRALLARQMQDWLKEGQLGLGKMMVGDPRLEKLSENVLTFLSEYLNAQTAAIFVREGRSFLRVATYGVPAGATIPSHIEIGDGLLGQAAKNGRSIVIRDVPEGYLLLGSSLGQGTPRNLLIAPLKADELVNAVVELGFVQPIDDSILGLLEREAGSIGVAIRSANDRARLQSLLEETQRQAEEMQTQGEELRVSNEELEEQSRAVKESQVQLELQQTELEQTNTQLEEQTRQLEQQRDQLSRAKDSLEQKATELEQASQYKSDFLANMSHELRTPLNSSLILSKLLADNPQGNLTEEQVRYAETIGAAGNDLLTLINDILDLSKIEAGHMEILSETVPLTQIADDLSRVFKPMADEKGLSFQIRIVPGCPERMKTDRQRLEQILKNLLSNAMKFTEKGEVSLNISSSANQWISFDVSDTGIGIPEQNQQLIFEAFRQGDGTTNRKYGGTGLGLSISRKLSECLGGKIDVASEPGRGSTFSLTLPESIEANEAPQNKALAAPPKIERRPPVSLPLNRPSIATTGGASDQADSPSNQTIRRIHRIEDDRAKLTGRNRVLLLVEDDEAFARILYDLAQELNFQCLIASTAEEGLALAVQFRPSAVVLDVGLPDQSGLSVLDRMKHDARTRHIPVHVVSAGDYAKTAMAMGAVGYMLKPVKRDDLSTALSRLEERLSQRMRRVLVVEDDAVQLDSLRKLLGTKDVETVGAQSAAECLERLKDATYDCMVLDLSLPDASGYSLLETLSREDIYAFPPVIVYTGRELSIDEEQNLRKYSKSIIIKGAKSPERLLDEVTLFLHQVVADLPAEQQRMLEKARSRDAAIEGRRILIVEDDVRNVFALSSILEPRGAIVEIARNGIEAIEKLDRPEPVIDLVLMDVMMPEMDGITATMEIRKRSNTKKLPIIMLTAKAMNDDQERCLAAGANDYMPKPLDVEKLLSLIRVWMPR